jgi:hypothetical protein
MLTGFGAARPHRFASKSWRGVVAGGLLARRAAVQSAKRGISGT